MEALPLREVAVTSVQITVLEGTRPLLWRSEPAQGRGGQIPNCQDPAKGQADPEGPLKILGGFLDFL